MTDDSRWKTIDSAPKDGTRILTYSPDLARQAFFPVRINRWLKGQWWHTNAEQPTHWQPLPDPPE